MASFIARQLLSRSTPSIQSRAYAAAPPPLDKPVSDDAETFINKAAQRLLFLSYRFLQPDFSQLALNGPLHSTQWLLPTPAQLRPSEQLRAFLAAPQQDPALEARRQETLSGGKLGAKYGKHASFQAVLALVKQGHAIDQAIVLKYYQKYPPQGDLAVTLAELYARITDDELVFDPVMGELQDIWKAPTADEIARAEEADPVAAAHLRAAVHVPAEEFSRQAEVFLKLHDVDAFDFSQPIPSQEDVAALPQGSVERTAHAAAREQYNRVVVKPVEGAVEQYLQERKGLADYERKALDQFAAKSVAEWKKNHAANDGKAEFAAPSGRGDPELSAKLVALLKSVENSQ